MANEKRLIDAIEEEMPYCPDTDYEIGYQNGLTMAKAIALKLDAVEVVHGRWVLKETMIRSPFAKNAYCSECYEETSYTHNYCPNCGAKMDGGADE